MNYATLALLIFAIFGEGKSQLTFDQMVDHFHDIVEHGTFKQRYWQKTVGPYPPSVGFLMIGGEAKDDYPFEGAWMKYAQQLSDDGFGVVCYGLEHRYYGLSQPPTAEYEFLNSNQALADIAYFINSISSQFGNKLKWVVFGGSYAGSLAAWARQNYPELIHAAVASSAPVEAKADLAGFDEVVRKSLTITSPDCVRELNLLVTQHRTYYLVYPITIDVQYGEAPKACSLIHCAVSSGSLESCLSENVLRYQKSLSFSGRGFSGDPWTKQVCNEFGWFPTSETEGSLFGNTLPLSSFVEDYCSGDFNDLYQGIASTNAMHHGKNFSTERVLFMHGSLDPWIVAGITTSQPNIPVHIIEGGSHCSDMDILNDGSELAQKVEAAQNIAMIYLRQWLQ